MLLEKLSGDSYVISDIIIFIHEISLTQWREMIVLLKFETNLKMWTWKLQDKCSLQKFNKKLLIQHE